MLSCWICRCWKQYPLQQPGILRVSHQTPHPLYRLPGLYQPRKDGFKVYLNYLRRRSGVLSSKCFRGPIKVIKGIGISALDTGAYPEVDLFSALFAFTDCFASVFHFSNGYSNVSRGPLRLCRNLVKD